MLINRARERVAVLLEYRLTHPPHNMADYVCACVSCAAMTPPFSLPLLLFPDAFVSPTPVLSVPYVCVCVCVLGLHAPPSVQAGHLTYSGIMRGHGDAVTSLSTTKTAGNMLVSSSRDNKVLVWDLKHENIPQEDEEIKYGRALKSLSG